VTSPLGEGAAPRTLLRGLVPLLGVGLFLAIWWAATDGCHVTGFAASFSLTETMKALRHLVFERDLWAHVAASLRRIAAGLALSVAIGVPLGCAVGAWPLFASSTTPLFQFVRMVSPLSWTPLAIMVFGVGDAPVLFLIVIAGVWPIVLATSSAVASLDRRLTTVGRALGGSPLEIARVIAWPMIRPQVLTGIRVSIGVAWVILVPAEMLGVDTGLGYFILSTRDRLAYSELSAAILIVGVLGFAIDLVARAALSERPGRTA
jgi:NitT/TauT family transport system permease protein